MTDYRAPLDDLRFVIKHQLDIPQYWPGFNAMEEVDLETVDAIFSEAGKICEEVIAPLNRAADEQGCQLNAGAVTTPQGFVDAYRAFNEGGWGALSGNPGYGGMGMPKSVVSGVEEMLQGACMAFGLSPMLTAGACLAIDAHASEELKQRYLGKMYSGQWSGSMCLTEPHAGTDLGLIRSKAQAQLDGSYLITGTKIFITWGDHDMAENIVHLVLAKLPDAPAGAKGISMFLVPKRLVDDDGETLGEANAVSCGALEKKMGIKASATCVMNFDGAKGWLVGPPNKGLACMFTMMNYERVVVGIQAIGAAQHAYQIALAYARERLQSRAPGGAAYPDKPADPLIVLPDVRRMLLNAKCHIEGGRALYIYVANCLDGTKYAKDDTQKRIFEDRVALLTPVAKAFLSDRCFEAAVSCQQVLGGHGYIREWGLEQLVRDIRITQIYEGTNGVQAADLLGRKTLGSGGGLLASFCDEIEQFIEANGSRPLSGVLQNAVATLRRATTAILQQGQQSDSCPEAAAMDYLDLLGYVSVAYMWFRASCVAQDMLAEGSQTFDSNQLQAKVHAAQYYFHRMLPIIETYAANVSETGASMMAIPDEMF
ncbi:MAG: acyl-CoA dehydrogenase C-terminal domain-containing protein [Cellvibrionaceae bacterium]|nr:acyl-CoA dehydrogenase C-terminal domain-containing protein [Cellvibrionaceae bacterium]